MEWGCSSLEQIHLLLVLPEIEAYFFALRCKKSSGSREAPHHLALRAQAEKEAAYRPRGKDGADATKEQEGKEEAEEGGEGPASPLLRDSKEQEPTTALSSATGGLPGAISSGDGDCTHHSFAVSNWILVVLVLQVFFSIRC